MTGILKVMNFFFIYSSYLLYPMPFKICDLIKMCFSTKLPQRINQHFPAIKYGKGLNKDRNIFLADRLMVQNIS